MEHGTPPSLTENHALSLISDGELRVYSVGISTNCRAEIRMAMSNPKRRIVATTIDQAGLDMTEDKLASTHMDDRISAKLENVSAPLSYPNATFDFVYARLVLHYLSAHDLALAASELYRILKPGGRFFVVVRSVESHDTRRIGTLTDIHSRLTTYTFDNPKTGQPQTERRYFHTNQSVRDFLTEAGFTPAYIRPEIEHIYLDFERTQLASEPDRLIEAVGDKPL